MTMRMVRSCVCVVLGLAAVGRAERFEIFPDHHSQVFSAQKEPVLRIHSGDTVSTSTWDSGGQDKAGIRHIRHPYVYPETGNPLMGPFYVEEADYGDALEVHLDKVRTNRNWGYTSYRLSPDILTAAAAEHQYKNFYKMDALRPKQADLIPWDIDLQKQTVRPRLLQSSGYRFEIPIRPMLGCIGVATARDEVMGSGPAGPHGGNMDFNEVVEGATLYFPVFHKGAYFYLGDGHAVQGDGEGLGNGVETSLDVEFTVNVQKKMNLSMPRLVSADYIMSIGSQPEFHSSMDFALRAANSDMLHWLTSEYKLSAPEANLLMGAVVQHKIATYFGTVATLIPRRFLPGEGKGQR